VASQTRERTTPTEAEVSDSQDDPSLVTVLSPAHQVDVVARLDDQVVSIAVEEGRHVAAGAILARLDDRSRKAVLLEREAELARAESAWSRAQALRQESMISDEQFVDAKCTRDVAVARRDEAQIDEDWCTVRTPITGIVSVRRVQVGQLVQQGSMLFRVSDPDQLLAELALPERLVGRVRSGQVVRLVPVIGGPAIAARVTRASSIVDLASGTFRVTIELDNRRLRLPAGITAHVDLGPGGAGETDARTATHVPVTNTGRPGTTTRQPR